MLWNEHSKLVGLHAPFGASKFHWINYDEEKVIDVYNGIKATEKGTQLHELADKLIKLGVKLPNIQKTLNMYVNDAIGFGMKTEQVLYYSDYFFGTTDAIVYNERDKTLRIHDLKTGSTPTHIEQLLIYAALFCLEYAIRPNEINIELRIYQNDDIQIAHPTAENIVPIIDKIILFNKILKQQETENE